ncbi:HAD-like protein [Aspergillus campestris IBT 28561]|uniref:HAD-like protein n=1 Tax=Aspergillus campestris (strain IBT 28561) TaxID=1392248 RepID=A0A2I1CWL5_ASPC2|nr:HAD-like protein [Aspergillus campestris IBT 28561]PKY02012.1 HAD-like protein [Aspergillus campestris IBT 28561]
MGPFKAVIFDIGDVLLTWTANTTTKIPGSTLKAMTQTNPWLDFERGTITPDECYRRLGEQFSVEPLVIADAFTQASQSLAFNITMTAFLRDLRTRGVRVYAMSNIPRIHFDYLRTLDYSWDLFDRIFASGYEGHRKPDVSFYQHVLTAIGVSADEVIFVDDKMVNVQAACDLGIYGVQFDSADRVCQKLRRLVSQ